MLEDHLASLSDDFARKMLGLIQYGARRMNRLTGKALALLQVDSGYIDHMYREARQAHEVHAVVTNAQNALSAETGFNGRDIPILIESAPRPLYVSGVHEYLVMMIAELLSNAVTFSPEGGRVRVSVQDDAERVKIVVQDDGRGIESSDLPLVWERFVQINRQEHEQQGAGLGLAIVRDIARVHQGDCTITSVPGHGTQVTLSLPQAQPSTGPT